MEPISTRGFTLMEVIISLAILAAIFSLGLFVSFDFYKSYAFGAEKNTIISVLQKARGQAIANINQKPHGVHFENNPLQYILFEGATYDPADANNIAINASYNISLTSPTLPFDVVFGQLSGDSADKTIIVSDGARSYTVSINSEGSISW